VRVLKAAGLGFLIGALSGGALFALPALTTPGFQHETNQSPLSMFLLGAVPGSVLGVIVGLAIGLFGGSKRPS